MDPQKLVSIIEVFENLFFTCLGIVVAIWYENLGAPRLLIEIEAPFDGSNRLGSFRFVRVKVRNQPRKVPLVTRQTAYAVHGRMSFVDSKGVQVGKTIPIRWDGMPEPIRYEVDNGKVITLPDTSLFRVSQYINIPPDEQETFAVAVKFQDDKKAYGWSNESYIHGWKHKEVSLPPGSYEVVISLQSGDKVWKKRFRLQNTDEIKGFQLTEVYV